MKKITSQLITFLFATTLLTGTAYARETIRNPVPTGLVPEVSAPVDGAWKDAPKGAELYSYVVGLCENYNGVASLVIPKRYGRFLRLTEVSALEAREFFASGQDANDIWLLACKGPRRFLVQKGYQYKAGDDGPVLFRSERSLEGINYVNAEKDRDYLTELTALENTSSKMTPRQHSYYLEKMALHTAAARGNIVKTHAGSRYTGSHSVLQNGFGKSCAVVKIEHTNRLAGAKEGYIEKAEKKTEKKVYRYMVCENKASRIHDYGALRLRN